MSAEARYCLESGCRSYDQAQYTIDGVKCNQCSSDTYTAIDASIDRDARSRPRKPADPINPIHYQAESGLESIEVIEAFGLNFNLGNAVKYILRAGKKTTDPTTDLQKAIWYLQREIEKCRKNTSA